MNTGGGGPGVGLNVIGAIATPRAVADGALRLGKMAGNGPASVARALEFREDTGRDAFGGRITLAMDVEAKSTDKPAGTISGTICALVA